MRVTQSMLSNNMLRNLSNSYSKMGKLQDQLATQKKITRPSDDPVVAMLGLGYRTDLNQVQQFSRNISEVNNWLDTTDDSIKQGVQVLQRIRELTVQGSNGTYEESQRQAIAVELEQLQQQLGTISKTQMGGKYIFNGVQTNQPPSDGNFVEGDINIEIFDGIEMTVNVNGQKLFGDLLKTDSTSDTPTADDGPLAKLIKAMKNPDSTETEIGGYLSVIDGEIDRFLSVQAEVGAKQNRVELMEERISTQEVISTKILSENEDVDIEKVITELISQESVHRAALSVGSRIIQPTLMDFLR